MIIGIDIPALNNLCQAILTSTFKSQDELDVMAAKVIYHPQMNLGANMTIDSKNYVTSQVCHQLTLLQ